MHQHMHVTTQFDWQYLYQRNIIKENERPLLCSTGPDRRLEMGLIFLVFLSGYKI